MPMLVIDRDAAHDAAQRELSKPIYPKATLSQHFNDWIDGWIYRLILEGSSVPGGWFTIAVLLTAVAVALVVATRIARQTMRTHRDGDYPLFGSSQLSAAEHRATAERFAAQHEWAAAIRHRLRAVARQLEENGVLNPVPGRTATELARDAGQELPSLGSELHSAAIAFNDVTYGEQPGTEASYRQIADLDEHLRARSAGSATAAPTDGQPESWARVQ
jgi:hypothetical protein